MQYRNAQGYLHEVIQYCVHDVMYVYKQAHLPRGAG